MLYCDRIDLSEEIDVAKSNNSKECIVCHYWFFNYGIKWRSSVCNGCHDLETMCLNINNTVISLLKVLIIVV